METKKIKITIIAEPKYNGTYEKGMLEGYLRFNLKMLNIKDIKIEHD